MTVYRLPVEEIIILPLLSPLDQQWGRSGLLLSCGGPNSITDVKLLGEGAGGEAYHAPASSARVKYQSCVFSPHYFFVRCSLIITLTNLRLSVCT